MGWWSDYKESRRYKESAYSCRHIWGLGLKLNQHVRIKMLENRFVFKARGLRLEVPKSEIRKIYRREDEEDRIDFPRYSGFWGLLSAAIFGPFGLLFGLPTRPPREYTVKKEYLIFKMKNGEEFEFFCNEWVPEIADRQTPKKFVADYERGEGYYGHK